MKYNLSFEITDSFRRDVLERSIMYEACAYVGYDKYCTIDELKIILSKLETLNKDKKDRA
jgi:hypothetical protein